MARIVLLCMASYVQRDYNINSVIKTRAKFLYGFDFYAILIITSINSKFIVITPKIHVYILYNTWVYILYLLKQIFKFFLIITIIKILKNSITYFKTLPCCNSKIIWYFKWLIDFDTQVSTSWLHHILPTKKVKISFNKNIIFL